MAKKQRKYNEQEKEEFKVQAQEKLNAFAKDVCQKLVDTITNGATDEWTRPWKTVCAGLPQNPVSNHQFSGGNLLALFAYMMNTGTPDPRFCTYKQAQKIGENTHVKKGEAGITILRPISHKTTDEETGEEDIKVFFRTAKVFHASQIDNMPELDFTDQLEARDWDSNDFVENFISASGVPVTHGYNQAAYFPGRDVIRMPDKNAFASAEAYYAIKFHEWMHATGHKDRENRFAGATKGLNGLKEKAREELCAETFSVMASMAFGMPYKMSTSADYIKYWLQDIDNDPREVFKQAVQATKMLGVAMSFAQGTQPDVSWFPDKSTWPSAMDGYSESENLENILGASLDEAEAFDDDDPFASLDDVDFDEADPESDDPENRDDSVMVSPR